jgi:hypothetical protein
MLLLNTNDKFELPPVGDHHIHLHPGQNDFQNLKDNLMQCSWKYGYQYFLTDVVTTQTVTPGDPPAVATINFSNSIKVLDVYNDKLLELAQKQASITWGDDSFIVQSLKAISEITQADGHLTAASRLIQKRQRPHSRMLAFKNNGKSNSFHII